MTSRSEPASETAFTVTDLKQFMYCPRIVYYTYCLPLLRPVTFKMEEGIRVHHDEQRREQRRSLRLYGLPGNASEGAPSGIRHFDLALRSAELGLSGRLDLAIQIEGKAPEAIPVEYKHSRKAGTHVKRQLAAYALLLQEAWAVPVRRAFIYFIPLRKAQELPMPPTLLKKVRTQIRDMREMVLTESMPDVPSRRVRCTACEFRRFCNDL